MLPDGEYAPRVGEEVLVTDHLGVFLVEEIDCERKTAVLRVLRSNRVMDEVAWDNIWPVDRTAWEIVAVQRYISMCQQEQDEHNTQHGEQHSVDRQSPRPDNA